MRKNNKSKVLKLYRKQKFLNLLSVKFLLPITALFLCSMGITGITIAIVLKNFALGGIFAGLGLSLSIASFTYMLLNGEDDDFFKILIKRTNYDMDKVKDENLFENQIYNKVQTLNEYNENLIQTKNLIQEMTAKLKQQKESENNEEVEQLAQEKLNLIKQKTLIKQQEKEILNLHKQHLKKNRRVQNLNPDIEVEYLGNEFWD